MTVASGSQALASDMLKHLNANGELELNASTELTIASGVIAPTQNFHRVDTQADAASDDLDTITLPSDASDGYLLFLRAEHASRTVVVKHNTGNIMMAGNNDLALDDTHDVATLIYDSNLTKWLGVGIVDTSQLVADASGISFFSQNYSALLAQITNAGLLTINDDTNAKMTVGLTINQGAADDELLAFKNSDVAHDMTTTTEADTFGAFDKAADAFGGIEMKGFTEDVIGLLLKAHVMGQDPARSTAATAAIVLEGRLSNGAGGETFMTADRNILAVRTASTTRFILDSDGEGHCDVGTSWVNFDDADDVELLNTLAANVSRPDDPFRKGFGEWLALNKQRLESLKLVTFNDDTDGHAFVNMTKLTMLLVGAARQSGARLNKLEKELSQIKKLLLSGPAVG